MDSDGQKSKGLCSSGSATERGGGITKGVRSSLSSSSSSKSSGYRPSGKIRLSPILPETSTACNRKVDSAQFPTTFTDSVRQTAEDSEHPSAKAKVSWYTRRHTVAWWLAPVWMVPGVTFPAAKSLSWEDPSRNSSQNLIMRLVSTEVRVVRVRRMPIPCPSVAPMKLGDRREITERTMLKSSYEWQSACIRSCEVIGLMDLGNWGRIPGLSHFDFNIVGCQYTVSHGRCRRSALINLRKTTPSFPKFMK